ncbi:MAG TPA: urea amidolyase associated protein UAAP1 [Mycobacteriales bacterium]|nr:urea amidolyase associated protein UAAP1 [Mycobacteriales bacterium]
MKETIPGGAAWSRIIRRGHALRLDAVADGANVSLLAYAHPQTLERLCIPDTLKAQMAVRITAPMVLMSDCGRALLSLTGSSVGWHDAITGHSTQPQVARRFGASSYQGDRNDQRLAARTGLLDELTKHGLGERDLHACVNLFTKVVPGDDDRGGLTYAPGNAHAGDWAELRAEQAVLVVLSTAPHPLDPSDRWSPSDVVATIHPVGPAAADDASRTFRAESARAIEQAERWIA